MEEKIEDLDYYIPFIAWVIVIAIMSGLLVLIGVTPSTVLKVAVGFILSWFLLLLLP